MSVSIPITPKLTFPEKEVKLHNHGSLNNSKYLSNLFKSSIQKFDLEPVIPTGQQEQAIITVAVAQTVAFNIIK